jgi:hypothetical protein
MTMSAATVGLLISGAGGTLLLAPAANAATATARPAGVHHVSPFGAGAPRSARDMPTRAARTVIPGVATTRYVSNSVPVGTGTSCASPGYATISDALAHAMSGDIIKVCAGSYNESLAITQSVTLKAVGAVTVTGGASPAATTSCDGDGGSQPNQDVVDICGTGPGSVSVTITGFTFQGNWGNVCYDSMYGVAVLGGASLNMTGTTVANIAASPLNGCQGGVGIEVGLATSATTADPGTATLANDTVTGYQKNGITVDGAGSNAKITGTTVTGAGPTPLIAQNGVQVSDSATSTISGSTISGNECDHAVCGPNAFTQTQSTGILAYDSGKTTVSSSNVYNNDLGVYNLEGFASAYYTPPAPFHPVPVSFTTMTLANRYENAGFDEGTTSLTSSTLSGVGEVGIEVFQYSGDITAIKPTATGNTITGATQDAILVASDGTSGDKAVKLTATMNSFDNSNGGGVLNGSTSILNVTNDWWGATSGPSVWSFGTGSSVSSDVNFFPWATDAGFTGKEPCTKGTNVASPGPDVVLCATPGTSNAFLQNTGTDVLLIGNSGNDQLVGSSTGETWMIGGRPGHNTFNGSGGTGYIQERGNPNDTLVNTGGYTVAPS